MAGHAEIDLSLFFSSEYLINGKLPGNAPLRELPFNTFNFSERMMERSWKALSWPRVDHFIKDADWVYAPMDTFLPTRKLKTAITIHDIQAFEDDLPWSHTREHQYFKRRWALWVAKAAKEADLVFTVSDFSRSRLIEKLGLGEEKVLVSGNAVDKEFRALVEEVEAPPTDFPYVVIIGGLRPKKGGHEILLLSRRFEKVWPELRFIVWGEHDPDMLIQARELANIQIMGMISDHDMVKWVKGAHASLFLSWYEGFGLPVLESMACNTPVICSNKASLPEIAGDAALLASPDQIDLLTEYILQLKSVELRKKMIEKGSMQSRKFCWDEVANNVINNLSSQQ